MKETHLSFSVLERWSLRPISMVFGDLSGDAVLDVADIDLLVAAISAGDHATSFDLTEDGIVDAADLAFWIHDVRKTYFGDANVDGEFNSRDFVLESASFRMRIKELRRFIRCEGLRFER